MAGQRFPQKTIQNQQYPRLIPNFPYIARLNQQWHSDSIPAFLRYPPAGQTVGTR